MGQRRHYARYGSFLAARSRGPRADVPGQVESGGPIRDDRDGRQKGSCARKTVAAGGNSITSLE